MAVKEGRLVEDAARAAVLLFVAPDEEERRLLVSEHGIDAHTLESALDRDEPPRLELEAEHAAVIFKSPRPYAAADRFVFRVSSLGLFLYRGRLVIVLAEAPPLLEPGRLVPVAGVEEAFLRVLEGAVHRFRDHLRVIDRMTEEIEAGLDLVTDNRGLAQLFALEKSLVIYFSAIDANALVLERLKAQAQRLGLTAKGLQLLDDVIVENSQCAHQAQIHTQVLASLMDARATVISNNLNRLMYRLTLITIAIMLPTLVVSLFSMNVGIPYQGHPAAFWVVALLAGASTAAVFAWWKRKGG